MTSLPANPDSRALTSRAVRPQNEAWRFLRHHAVWFLLEALFIIAFMAAYLGMELSDAPVELDVTTCIVGLACGAWIGGVTAAIVAFTALFLLLFVDLVSPTD